MMRLFTRTELLPEGKKPCFLLWPLLGITEDATNDPDYGRFENYLREGKSLFTLVDAAEEADAVVLPFEYTPEEKFRPAMLILAEEAKAAGKPLLVFYNSDFTHAIDLPNAIVFRTTGFRNQRMTNEHGFPGWSVDFLKYNEGKFTPLKKTDKPRVSYCGYIDYSSTWEMLRYKFNSRNKEEMYRIGPELRGEAVRVLRSDNRIETDFIIRNGFWAQGESDKNEARRVYAQNMLQSPYALVARGAGNFSYRLYEVLSCGRIPVFIDTDGLLPFDEFVDWKAHVCRTDAKDVKTLAKRLLEFHASLSVADFEELQFRNRQLYETWIRPEAFFRQIEHYILR